MPGQKLKVADKKINTGIRFNFNDKSMDGAMDHIIDVFKSIKQRYVTSDYVDHKLNITELGEIVITLYRDETPAEFSNRVEKERAEKEQQEEYALYQKLHKKYGAIKSYNTDVSGPYTVADLKDILNKTQRLIF